MTTYPVRNLSYSSVSAYLDCGQYWYFKYIRQFTGPSSDAALFGTAFHKSAQAYITQPEAGAKQLHEFFPDIWVKTMTEWQAKSGPIQWTKSPVDQMEEGHRLCQYQPLIDALDQLKPKVEGGVASVEKFYEFRVPGVDVPVVAYIDFIQADGIPLDFKTTGKPWTAEKSRAELQPLFYIHALRMASQKTWKFKHFVVVRGSPPQIQIFENEYQMSDIQRMLDSVLKAWQGIQENRFLLAPPDHWKCERYCEYFKICRGKHPDAAFIR